MDAPINKLEATPPGGVTPQNKTTLPLKPDEPSLPPQRVTVPNRSTHPNHGTQKPGQAQALLNLPVSITPLVGRRQETALLKKMLGQRDVRLLTLTGPGGVGKTRLALHCAAELLPDFKDGVYFVSLVALHDPALVAPAIVQRLGLKDSKDQPLVALLSHLGDKQLLLVLDNFEQVTRAAALVGQLLAAAPGLKVLLTSRVRLRLYGEHEFNVPMLTLPQPDQPETLAQSEAVNLFLQRGRAVRSDFALTPENNPVIGQICTRLDGLPLAIELAAARLKILSPAAILSRLDKRLHLLTGGPNDVPAHQQTLRNTLDWSYDLLDPAEQVLFQNLALFADGATLEALEAVLGSGNGQEAVGSFELLNSLNSLIDKSLLSQGGPLNQTAQPRFKLLETMRQYAIERLIHRDQTQIKALRSKHSVYYRQLAEEGSTHLLGSVQQDWLDRLEADQSNFRVALEWASANDRLNGLKLAIALSQFWYLRGYWREGLGWLNQLIDAAPSDANPVRAGAIQATGLLAYNLGEVHKALALYQESFEQWQLLDDKVNKARALTWLGLINNQLGDFPQAQIYYRQALTIHHSLGNNRGAAAILSNLGNIATNSGDYDLGWRYSLEGLGLARQAEDQILICAILNNLGWVASNQENWPVAQGYVEESLGLARKLGIKRSSCRALENLGLVAIGQSDWPVAAAYLEESLSLAQAAGEQHGIATARLYLGLIAYRQKNYLQAANLAWSSLNISLVSGDRALIAEGLSVFSSIMAAQPAYHNLAARLAGTLHALQDVSGIVLERVLQLTFGAALLNLQTSLAPNRFDAEFAQGRSTLLSDLKKYLAAGPSSADYLLALWTVQPVKVVVTGSREIQALSDQATPQASLLIAKTRRFEPWESLTERERAVLQLLATTSLTSQEMAREMSVAVSTVRTHIKNIYSKLDIQNRFQAIHFARELGLL